MTIETDLNVMEHAGRTWRFTLKNESGEVLPLDGYVIYGAAECPGQALRAFTVEVKGGVATVRMPGLPVGDWPWKYQIFVLEVSSRVEWLLCCGSVNVLGRVAGGHVALSPEQLEFTGVLDRVTQQASIVVGENMVSIAENARHAAQAALDSQIARGDAEAARDGALAARAGAEAARDGAKVAQGVAEAARDDAQVAKAGAEAAKVAADDAAGVAAGSAEAAVVSAAEAKAAAAGAAGAADAVRFDLLPLVLEWLVGWLRGMLGEGNFTVTQGDARVTVVLALETTAAQVGEVQAMVGRVLPRNLEKVIMWADGLPVSYKHVEYLETTDVSNSQFISTGIIPTIDTSCKMRIMGLESKPPHVMFAWSSLTAKFSMLWGSSSGYYQQFKYGTQTTNLMNSSPAAKPYKWRTVENRKNEMWIDNVLRATLNPEEFVCDTPLYLFVGNATKPLGRGLNRCSGFEAWEGDVKIANYIPVVKVETSEPGMFDTINGVFKTNDGAGHFSYPGKEEEPATYSLRNRMYGKITEHGVRRLYRVPVGYGSKEEYAAEHGYKLMVETPVPGEGCWSPVWHDREDCIELEWVETEVPTEEETLAETE